MYKISSLTMVVVLLLLAALPGPYAAAVQPSLAYAPPPPPRADSFPAAGDGSAAAEMPFPAPTPGSLPPEVEGARARQAIEAVLNKYLAHWGPSYQVAPVEVAVAGEWAHGVARWQGQALAFDGPIHILARRLADGEWQALMPGAEGLYLRWVDQMPESLLPMDRKLQLQRQAAEVDALTPRQRILPTESPSQTLSSQGSQQANPDGSMPDLSIPTPTSTPSAVSPQADPIPDDQDWRVYADENYGFAVKYPPTWYLHPTERQGGGDAAVLEEPADAGSVSAESPVRLEIGVFLHDKPLSQSLAEWAKPAEWMLPSLVAERYVSIGELNAFQQVFQLDDRFVIGTYLPRDTKVYFISALVSHPELSAEVLSIIHSFRFAGTYTQPQAAVSRLYGADPVAPVDGTSEMAPSGFRLPFDGSYLVSNGPGEGYHTGTAGEAIDFPMVIGTAVKATEAGSVSYRDWSFGYGWTIELQHGNGMYSWYAHLSEYLVSSGQQVSKGASIAKSGNSSDPGYSTGPHLHFHVRSGSSAVCIRDLSDVWWNTWFPPGNPDQYSGCACYPSCGSPPSQCSQGARALSCGGGDTTDPDGDITSPSEGATVNSSSVHLAGWASDSQSGFNHAHFTAYYGGSWRQVGPDFTSSPFGFDWNMCDAGVPDGSVTLGLDIWDNAGNQANSPRGNRHFTKSYNCSPPSCNPNADQIALYVDGNYSGQCVVKGIGEYSNPGAIGLPNDSISSVKVGGNVKAVLCRDDNYGGGCDTFTGDDSNLGDNGIGDNQVSSAKVEWRTSPPAAPGLQSPGNGSVFNEGQGISLAWSATGNEYYGEVWGGPAGTSTFGWQGGTTKDIGSQWAGYTYSWHVKARNGAGESPWSSTWSFTVRPATPTNLGAQAVSCAQVNLGWTDNSGNEEGYKIYRNGSYLAQVGANVQSYQDTGLSGGSTYSYYVKAFRGSIESAASNTANATTPGCDCPTITGWKGEYWTNPSLSGSRTLCRNDFSLDFDWAYGSPDPSVPADGFSARWTRNWNFAAGNYRFHMLHDDGARLYVDDGLSLDSWGTCCTWDSVDLALSGGSHTLRMEMFENGGAANADLWWERLDISGWRGEYYNNDSFADHPILVRDDGEDINFEWSDGSPDPLVQQDDFSVRWTRSIWFSASSYRFDIFHDDGARLFVDGTLVFENWCNDCRLTESVSVPLSAGAHTIKLETFENGGWAGARLAYTALSVCGDSWEPNDDRTHATSLGYGQSKSAFVCEAGDVDYYRFDGLSGDPVVIDIAAAADGSALDSYIYLIGSDGSTVLAQNDDAAGSYDSKLAYSLPGDGTYYIKVREFNHGVEGGYNYFYSIHLFTDTADPSSAEIVAPTPNEWIDPSLQTVIADATDDESGIKRVEFLWHDADWANSDWVWLGADVSGQDGWSWNANTGSQPEQRGGAYYIWAFDWVGHWTGAGVGNLGIDRTPPTVAAGVQPPYGDAPFVDFWVSWGNGSDNLSGIDAYDVQYRDGAGGTWTDWETGSTNIDRQFVGTDGHTYYFQARAVDRAGNQGAYAGGDGDAQHTVQVCPVAADAYEADDAYATARSIATDGAWQAHNTHAAANEDWVRFYAAAGVMYTLVTTPTGEHADTVLYLYEPDGTTPIANNDDGGPGYGSRLDWQPAAPGTYLAMVKHWDSWAYGCTTGYDLAVSTDDETPPTGSLVVNSGAGFAVSTAVALTVAASDAGTGVEQMMVSNNAEFSGATWVAYTGALNWNLAAGDGTKTVYVKLRDRAGNQSPAYSDSIVLDTTAPTGSIVIQGGAETVTDRAVSLSLNASDQNAVVHMRLRNNTESWTAWQAFAATRSWQLPSLRGEHTVWVQFQDVAGHVSIAYADTVFLDLPVYHAYLPAVTRNR